MEVASKYCSPSMEIRKRPKQLPKQHRAAFGGEAAQSHQSRPDPLETSWDLASVNPEQVNPEQCLKPFERFISCNNFSKPVLTQCSHCQYCIHLRRNSSHSWVLRNGEGPWWVWQQRECGGSSMWLKFSHTRGHPSCPVKHKRRTLGKAGSLLVFPKNWEGKCDLRLLSGTEWEVFRAACACEKPRWRLCPHGTGQQTMPRIFHKACVICSKMCYLVCCFIVKNLHPQCST